MVDYPGKVAATIFTRGCTFRCGFCHNPELVLQEEYIPLLDENEILNFLHTRINKLQGICITGGEPTMNPDLPEFIKELKKMNFAIKLDTNGSIPDMVEKLIETGDIDYIAMDIKSPLNKYLMVTNLKSQISNPKFDVISSHPEPTAGWTEGGEKSYHMQEEVLKNNIQRSIKLIMNSGIDYEFRTTIVKPLHAVGDFKGIGDLIKGAKRYYLQNFVRSKHIQKHNEFEAFSDEEIEKMVKIMEPFVQVVELRS